MGLFGVHPALASLVYRKWPYGDQLCRIFYFIHGSMSYTSAVLLVCALQVNKVYLIVFPLRAVGKNRRPGHIMSTVVWLLAGLYSMIQIIVDETDVVFDDRAYRCLYAYSAPIWRWLSIITAMLFILIPNLIIVTTTISLIVTIRKANRRINKRGLVTVLFVGFTYFIANAPLSLYIIVFKNMSHLIPSQEARRNYDNILYTTVSFILFINCFANGIVYYRSVNSFKIFLKQVFLYLQKKFIFNRTLTPAFETIRLKALRGLRSVS